MESPEGAGTARETGAATPDQPVRAAERLVSLDFVRGVAVLGILFANITAFGQPYLAYFWPQALAEPATMADKNVWLFQTIFVDHKFRGLFTLLFGAGIYLFMERAWARGRGRGLQLRRLGFLALFGLVHYFLIWRGDILTAYAFTGMAALALVRLTARTQMITGLTLYVLGFVLMALAMGGQLALAKMPELAAQADPKALEQIERAPAESLDSASEEVTLYTTGSYADIVENVVTEHWSQLVTEVFFIGLTETLGLVLIGMALYRRGFFSGQMNPRKMKTWGWAGIAAGIVLTVPLALWPYRTGFDFFTTLFVFNAVGRIGQLPMALGLAALLVLWAPAAARGWLGERLVAAGRMAFSNYLGTSIVMMFVFHGWAIGLFGAYGRLELMGVVAAWWVVMLAWSKAWLERFRYGPLEWLWRCLTYGRRFPLRR